jgi:hypothetical protein
MTCYKDSIIDMYSTTIMRNFQKELCIKLSLNNYDIDPYNVNLQFLYSLKERIRQRIQ